MARRGSHCTEITHRTEKSLVAFPGDANYSLLPAGSLAFRAFYFQSALALSGQAVCVWSSCLEIPPVILLNHS